MIAGEALDQMSICEKLAAPGEVYISGQCWKLIYEHVIVTEEFATTDPEVKAIRTGNTWEVSSSSEMNTHLHRTDMVARS